MGDRNDDRQEPTGTEPENIIRIYHLGHIKIGKINDMLIPKKH